MDTQLSSKLGIFYPALKKPSRWLCLLGVYTHPSDEDLEAQRG